MPRVAIYCRVSTSDKGQDTDNQLTPLRQYAASQSWKVVREYIEHESASGKVQRAQFSSMMNDARSNAFDIILFWSLDRFSREGAAKTLHYLSRLSDSGVGWKSLQEPYLDTTSLGPFQEAVIAIIAAIAKMETDRRSERVKAGLERRRREGKPVGARAIPLDEKVLAKLYAEGYSLVALSNHFRVSRGTIRNRLRSLGILKSDDI